MKRHTSAAPSAVALIVTVIALNTLGAAALPSVDAEEDALLVEERGPSGPTNTPAAPVRDGTGPLERIPSDWAATGAMSSSPSSAMVGELLPTTNAHAPQPLDRAKVLRQAGTRVDIPNAGTYAPAGISPQSTSEAMCVGVLWNPQVDVVEFGDGTGSVEYWSILFQKVYHDNREGYYTSPIHSLALADELDGSDADLVVIEDVTWDYDSFAQGFYAPPNLTSLRVHFSNVHAELDSYDSTRSYIWTLTPDGYLDDWVAYADIPEGSEWASWYWDLPGELVPVVAGRPLAAAFEMLSDRVEPGEIVWLDDLQVTVCFELGQYGVYLPLVAKQPSTPSQPTCSPREPDSLAQPGSTAVGATCGGSFSPLDEKDYFTLDLRGEKKVRLRLFDLPPGTNWDALIYENTGGYPLACQIGDPGSGDKSENCTLSLSKDYFVMVSRGPEKTVGTYGMRVEAR